MTVCDTVLQKIAERCELKHSQRNQLTAECLSEIEELLQNVYASRQPKASDYEERIKLVGFMNDISKELYGSSAYPTIEEYGSFVMGIFSPNSDLDLSIRLSDTESKINRSVVVKSLGKFAEKLIALERRGHFCDLKRIFSAKVPIIKVIHCGSGIECDISVENQDGIKKSKIIQIICGIDVRFQQLSFLFKEWAKAHQINSARTKTMNSLSIVSLVAFHLQTREPPILPPFSVIFRDGMDPEKVMEVASEYKDFGKFNKESTADLFLSFLVKLSSVKQYWSKGLCASTFHGTWTLKLWADEIGFLSVEDFSTRSENVARAVKREQLGIIYDCISNSLNHLARFKEGLIQKTELKGLLFGQVPKFSKRPNGLQSKTRPVCSKSTARRKERRAEKRKATLSRNAILITPTGQSTLIHENLHATANIGAAVQPIPDPYWACHAGPMKRLCKISAPPLVQKDNSQSACR